MKPPAPQVVRTTVLVGGARLALEPPTGKTGIRKGPGVSSQEAGTQLIFCSELINTSQVNYNIRNIPWFLNLCNSK